MTPRRLVRVAGAAALVATLAGVAVVVAVHLIRRATMRREGVLVMPAGWQNDVDINMTCDSMCIPCLECKKWKKQPAPQQAQLAALTANNYGRPKDWVGPYGRGPDGGVAAFAAQQATATPSPGSGPRSQDSQQPPPSQQESRPSQQAQQQPSRQGGGGGGNNGSVPWRQGNATWYESYPDCCNGGGGDRTECEQNSGCSYQGKFADGSSLSKSEVAQSNIVAFFVPPNDRNRREWDSKYKGRWLRIKSGSRTIDAEIKDTCDDKDCPSTNCCTTNARSNGGQYLLDLESNTSRRLFGSKKNGTVDFIFVTGPGGSPVPWSQVGL